MIKCWCGNEDLDEYSQDYYVCHNCGTLVTKRDINSLISVVSDENNDLYGSNYWTNKMVKLSQNENINGLVREYFGGRVPYWIQYIIRYIPFDCSIAEVGCGLGQLSYFLKWMGYQQTAYEVSPQICNFLKREMGLNVVCGEFGSVNEIYEAILNFDLLEHLVDPKAFVSECRARLWGKSVFCCQTPCYTEEWSYEDMLVSKPEFSNLLVPEQHIYIFSKRAITKLLMEAGFSYINFETPAFGEYYDMFLFASPNPIEKLNSAEVESNLYETPNRLMVKTLVDFFNRLSNATIID